MTKNIDKNSFTTINILFQVEEQLDSVQMAWSFIFIEIYLFNDVIGPNPFYTF